MTYRLTQDEKDRLIREERQRRILVRKQQVRAQADEFSRQLRNSVKEKAAIIAEAVRNDVRSGIQSRLSDAVHSTQEAQVRRSPRLQQKRKSGHGEKTKTPLTTRVLQSSAFSNRRSIHASDKSLSIARKRGEDALKRIHKGRRSEEKKKNAVLARREAAKHYFTQVSKQGAENVPMMR